MDKDSSIMKFLIAFILGYLVYSMMRGDGMSVGGAVETPQPMYL